MNRVLKTLTAAWLIAAVSFFGTMAGAEILDRIVASVNGEIITLRELNERVEPLSRAQNAADPAQVAELRNSALDAMILQKLILQKGKELGINVTDQDVDGAIERIKSSNNITQQQLEDELRSKGTNLVLFRQDIKADITKARLINEEVRSRIVVPDEAVYNYLKKQGRDLKPAAEPSSPQKKSVTGKVHVRNIYFPLPQDATGDVIASQVDKAEQVRAEIQGGLSFAAAAAMHSESSNAEEGGDLGLIAWDEMNEKVRASLEGLKEGDISEPIIIGGGVQLFQVVDVGDAPDEPQTVADNSGNKDAKDVSISGAELEKVRQLLVETKLKSKFDEWVGELKSKAIIKKSL